MADVQNLRKLIPTDEGACHIVVKLYAGSITVTHGESGEVLLEKLNAPPGTWDGMWEGLKRMGFREPGS